MDLTSTYTIESRIQLFSALAEAAELEHNLMCLYLFAMFSLKRNESEGVSKKELEAIQRWRQVILGIALEEMNHLTLVANLMVAAGGTCHFMRPNLPSAPGLYPADIIIELARFDMSTIEHFIYLERPRSEEIKDGETFSHDQTYQRFSPKGRLMPSSGDYQTVGDLYVTIQAAFEDLCAKHGEEKVFCGSKAQQIGPLDSLLPGLTVVCNKADALRAIETIITQGEGATDVKDSHFERFMGIKNEYAQLLKENPSFAPARNVARNPVMRKPLVPENRVWVTNDLAAQYMDLANALYALMLRLLVQIYSIDDRPREAKETLLNASYTIMHAMASVAETLTFLPANETQEELKAGISFAMVRSLAPLDRHAEKKLFCERLMEISEGMNSLQKNLEQRIRENPHVQNCADELRATQAALLLLAKEVTDMPEAIHGTAAASPSSVAVPAGPAPIPKDSAKTDSAFAHGNQEVSSSEIEISETPAITLSFEAKKCMHSRHCVTELPNVFKANTPGKWIFAENADPNLLEAVARECPSGAIQYRRKDGAPQERPPDVNLVHLRENGPYAFLADLVVDGKKVGTRATLCRCGNSQNKPFCDGAHNAARFTASGEPATMDDTSLNLRNGPLKIDRNNNGPLSISGNVEICSGTGRIVLRTKNVRMCRCGHSKSKPVCDNSHIVAGFKDEVIREPKAPSSGQSPEVHL